VAAHEDDARERRVVDRRGVRIGDDRREAAVLDAEAQRLVLLVPDSVATGKVVLGLAPLESARAIGATKRDPLRDERDASVRDRRADLVDNFENDRALRHDDQVGRSRGSAGSYRDIHAGVRRALLGLEDPVLVVDAHVHDRLAARRHRHTEDLVVALRVGAEHRPDDGVGALARFESSALLPAGFAVGSGDDFGRLDAHSRDRPPFGIDRGRGSSPRARARP
jgi:hypothetical protein